MFDICPMAQWNNFEIVDENDLKFSYKLPKN